MRKTYVPVPPESPVVSVSRNSTSCHRSGGSPLSPRCATSSGSHAPLPTISSPRSSSAIRFSWSTNGGEESASGADRGPPGAGAPGRGATDGKPDAEPEGVRVAHEEKRREAVQEIAEPRERNLDPLPWPAGRRMRRERKPERRRLELLLGDVDLAPADVLVRVHRELLVDRGDRRHEDLAVCAAQP